MSILSRYFALFFLRLGLSNWAYMVIASLAWSLKAWFGLLLSEKGRWASKHKAEKRAVVRMEFKPFVNAFIRVPAQIVCQGEKLFTACSRGTLGNRFFFVALTSLRQGYDVEIEGYFFVTNTLLTEELSPQAIYEPLRHGKDSSP